MLTYIGGMIRLFSFSLIFLPAVLCADASMETSDTDRLSQTDQVALSQLTEKIYDLTTRVSKSRLNADYVPGMVTVYYGTDLAERGVRTVGEAMTRVPGINYSLTSDTLWKTVVRGIPTLFASGHIKILLNGNPVITTLGIDLIPNIPIEQVEKIEMIRGPASAMYGEFAYAGVLNVITRTGDNGVFTGAGSYDTYSAGGNFSKQIPEKDLSMSLNLAFQSTRRGTLDTGDRGATGSTGDDTTQDQGDFSDGASADDEPVSFLPSTSERSDKHKNLMSTVLDLNYKGFSFTGYYLGNAQGDFYTTHQQGLFLSQELPLTANAYSLFKLGWQRQASDEDYERFYVNGGNSHPVFEITYDAEIYQGSIELFFNDIERHNLHFEWTFTKSEPVNLWRNTATFEESYSYDGRMLNSLMVQDDFTYNDQGTLTYGARYDHYDDLGDTVSPRVALVYRLNKRRSDLSQHILKVQYGRAFRPLTFLEMYNAGGLSVTGNPNTDFQTVDTFELGYIYKDADTVGRVTTFYSDMEAWVETEVDPGKTEDYRAFGTELEFEKNLVSDVLTLTANCSWVHAENKETGEKPDETTPWLVNGGLLWQPLPWISLGTQYRYVYVPKTNHSDDSHSLDLTVSSKTGIKDLTIQGGVKNIFEDDVRYPSHLDQDRLTGNNFIAYPENYQKPERWWWIKVAYDF